MTSITYTNNMPYSYDPTHRGAHYMIGNAYKNNGEFLESVAKFHRGLEYLVNPATSYDNGSDIEELNASVKSSGASLACVYGFDMKTILDTYFANVHSTLWIYMVQIDDEITEYHMNAAEFRTFLETWAKLAKESGSGLLKIRMKAKSGKMIRWLEDQVNA